MIPEIKAWPRPPLKNFPAHRHTNLINSLLDNEPCSGYMVAAEGIKNSLIYMLGSSRFSCTVRQRDSRSKGEIIHSHRHCVDLSFYSARQK